MQKFRDLWAKVDVDMDRSLSLKEIKKLVNMLNYDISDENLKELFNKFDSSKNGSLEFDEFILLMDSFRIREELRPFFKKYEDPGTKAIEIPEFANFLI